MKIKHLLSFFILFFLFSSAQGQQMKPADPVLRMQLEKYAADNHLQTGTMYIYLDTVAKKAVRFQAGSFLVMGTQSPAPQPVAKPAGGSPQNAAGNFHLVKDVETATNSYPNISFPNSSSPIQAYAVLNNVAYFAANDGIHGTELWRSDGTAAGTYLFKDIYPGETSAVPANLFAAGGHLLFLAQTPNSSGLTYFSTDGVDSNLVTLFPSGITFSVTSTGYADAGNYIYFATGTYRDYKIWKTDGTQQGTTLVKDYSGIDIQNIRNLTYAGGLVYFTAYTGATGSELYRCDGTAAGTYMVKDINNFPDLTAYSPVLLTPYNGKLYFAGNTGSGYKLWMSDGTAPGTQMVGPDNENSVINVNNANYTAAQSQMLVKDGVLYFSAYGDTTGWELHKYDASGTDGIRVVKDIRPGATGYAIAPYQMAALSNGVFFFYYDGNRYQLYKTDGTAAGTFSIEDFGVDAGIYNLYAANDKLYFAAGSDYTDAEPWVSDGTAAGTMRLDDVYPGKVGSQPSYFTSFNGSVLFQATDDTHGNELFINTGNTVQLVKDINTTATGSSSNNNNMTPFKDGVIKSAYTYGTGVEPYIVTNTSEDLLQDIFPAQMGSNPGSFVVKNNEAYFRAATSRDSAGIFKTNGKPGNITSVIGNISGLYSDITVTDNGNLFYITITSGSQPAYQLWKTDGTPEGKVLLGSYLSISTTYNNGKISFFTPIGNTVYYVATTSELGSELYKSDGTVAGTGLVKDINTGASSSFPNALTVYKGKLFFSTYDGIAFGFWQTDGTEANTLQLAPLQVGNLQASGDYLYFSGATAQAGFELWKTDGTTAGTVLLKDIVPGSQSSSPMYLTDVDGTLYFQVFDANYNPQLYKSNGTQEGTIQVSAFTDYNVMSRFTAAGGKLFFILGNKLWVSNGFSDGTLSVDDEVMNDVFVTNMGANGSNLFVEGYTYRYGGELYAGNTNLVVLPVTLTSFNASLKNTDVFTQWQTSSEVNASYFNVQRSTDGIHFTDIGKVTAKGSSSTYSYPDINIASLVSVKTIYYRLQTVDKDGSTTFSNIVPVNLSLKDAVVLLLPNPVKDVLKIRISNYSGKAAISLFDENGKNVYTIQQQVQSGSDVSINASSLQSGVYMVKISLKGKTIQQKFIKE